MSSRKGSNGSKPRRIPTTNNGASLAPSQSQLQPQPQPQSQQSSASSPPRPASTRSSFLPSPSPGTPHRASDARSLLAPSFSSTVPARSLAAATAAPSATLGISASPSNFSIGRSPSGGQYGPQGGAAARLRRVASNASLAPSINMSSAEGGGGAAAAAAATVPGAQAQAAPDAREEDIAPDTISRAAGTESSQQDRVSSSSSPQSNQAQAASGPSAPAAPASAEAGAKRPHTPSQLRPEHAAGRQARRKTWFGWTTPDDEDDPSPAPKPGQSHLSAGKPSPPQPPQPSQAHPSTRISQVVQHPAPSSQQPTQDASEQVRRPSRSSTRDEAVAPAAATDPVAAASTVTRKGPLLDVQAAERRERRTSWFGWRTPPSNVAKVDGQDAAHTGAGHAMVASTDTASGKGIGEQLDRDTAMRTPQDTPDPPAEGAMHHADTTSAATSEVKGRPAGASAVLTTRSWALWPTSKATESQPASNPPDGQPSPASKPEEAMAETRAVPSVPQPITKAEDMETTAQPPQGTNASSWSSWIPYWGYMTSNTAEAQSDASASESAETQSGPQLTPAEQVKAAALARPEVPSLPIASLSPSDAVLNPATKASWISYFSSRSARPAGKVEAVEPEVMEIDFSEAEPQTRAPSPKPKGKNGKDGPAIPTVASATQFAKRNRLAEPRPASSSSRDAPQPDPAPPVSRPTTPLTGDKSKAQEIVKKSTKDSKKPSSLRPPIPNLVLPTFEDTFSRPPRSLPPPAGVLKRTLNAMNAWLSSQPADSVRLRTAPRTHQMHGNDAHPDDIGLALAEKAALRLPRSWSTMAHRTRAEKRGCVGVKRICVVALHGWFAQSWASKFMGEPTGTSIKFATGMRDAVLRHFKEVDGMELNAEAITMIPLSADGTVQDRVDRSFAALLSRREWVEHLQSADAIFFACHSQGCIVGTHLLARLIEQSYVQPRKTRIALLAMCGIHAGPFEHLRSTVVASYVNYFETAAAKELFEFHQADSAVSRRYHTSLRVALDAGVKYVFVASTDDQVVPLHSALFSSAKHPSILRALYVHGSTFPKLDFLTNMLTFCVAVRNAGLSDHDLLALLSTSVAGSLYGGLGHSLCYDEPKTYDLAARYLFETTHPLSEPTTRPDEANSHGASGSRAGPPKLELHEAFEVRKLQNPHLLPWSLRGLLEDRAVRATFGEDIYKLLHDFESWRPQTKTLKDVQYRLEPMRSIPRPTLAAKGGDVGGSGGKAEEGSNGKLAPPVQPQAQSQTKVKASSSRKNTASTSSKL